MLLWSWRVCVDAECINVVGWKVWIILPMDVASGRGALLFTNYSRASKMVQGSTTKLALRLIHLPHRVRFSESKFYLDFSRIWRDLLVHHVFTLEEIEKYLDVSALSSSRNKSSKVFNLGFWTLLGLWNKLLHEKAILEFEQLSRKTGHFLVLCSVILQNLSVRLNKA